MATAPPAPLALGVRFDGPPLLLAVALITLAAIGLAWRGRAWEPLTLASAGVLLGALCLTQGLLHEVRLEQRPPTAGALSATTQPIPLLLLAGCALGAIGAFRAWRTRTRGALLGGVLALQSLCVLSIGMRADEWLRPRPVGAGPTPPLFHEANPDRPAPGDLSILEAHLWIEADGTIRPGQRQERAGLALDDATLLEELRQVARSSEPPARADPDSPLCEAALLVRMDERAPYAALERVSRACAHPDVLLYRLQLAVRSAYDEAPGKLSLTSPVPDPREGGLANSETVRTWLRARRLDGALSLSAGARGGPALLSDASLDEFEAWLSQHRESTPVLRDWLADHELALLVDPDLQWGELTPALDLSIASGAILLLRLPDDWPAPPD